MLKLFWAINTSTVVLVPTSNPASVACNAVSEEVTAWFKALTRDISEITLRYASRVSRSVARETASRSSSEALRSYTDCRILEEL